MAFFAATISSIAFHVRLLIQLHNSLTTFFSSLASSLIFRTRRRPQSPDSSAYLTSSSSRLSTKVCTSIFCKSVIAVDPAEIACDALLVADERKMVLVHKKISLPLHSHPHLPTSQQLFRTRLREPERLLGFFQTLGHDFPLSL